MKKVLLAATTTLGVFVAFSTNAGSLRVSESKLVTVCHAAVQEDGRAVDYLVEIREADRSNLGYTKHVSRTAVLEVLSKVGGVPVTGTRFFELGVVTSASTLAYYDESAERAFTLVLPKGSKAGAQLRSSEFTGEEFIDVKCN